MRLLVLLALGLSTACVRYTSVDEPAKVASVTEVAPPTEQVEKKSKVTLGAGGEIISASAGAPGFFGGLGEVGHWFGSLRLTGRAGVGQALCTGPICPRVGEKVESGMLVPLGLELSHYPLLARGYAAGVGVRLQEGLAWLPTRDLTLVHQAFLVPRVAITPGRDPQRGTADIEIPVGMSATAVTGPLTVGPSVGVGIAVRFPQ
jgi:hypothetical protein